AVLEQMVRQQPNCADAYRRLVALLQRACDFTRAAEVIEEAAERWPSDWMLLLRFNRLPIEPARFNRIFQRFATGAAGAAQKDNRLRLQLAIATLQAGEIEQ